MNISLALPCFASTRKHGVRCRIVLPLALSFGLSLVGMARADVRLSSAVADTVRHRTFAIPAQPLMSALARFERQAGIEVTGEPSVRAGRRSTGIAGTFTPGDALRGLLAGTGLVAVFSDESTVDVRTAPAVQTIAALEVVGHRDRKGYALAELSSATKTATALRDVPQSITIVTRAQIADQAMQGMADVVRYLPGMTIAQGEGNRDQAVIRGNSTTAGFFVDGVRDDVQYFRDLYNVDRVEGLKGANALIFGRGVGGGVINRVSKEAGFAPLRELTLQGGSYGSKRIAGDLEQGVSGRVAFRLNAMYENSDQFRRGVNLERSGINPTLTFTPSERTILAVGFEHFTDHRTADRGIPSFGGGPAGVDVATFFGDPTVSRSDARVDVAVARIEHRTRSGLTLRNRSRYAAYDKIYQNVYPGGAVDAASSQVNLAAYNNATNRVNFFNQSELAYQLRTGSVAHSLLAGVEVGRQVTDNFRNTGYFGNTTTSIAVPFDHPTISTPVTFRQGATDADNHVGTTILSLYAQNQIAVSARWQVIAGVRYERFDLAFHNNRTNQNLERKDDLVSPRLGLLYKATGALSFYSSYGVSFLPSAGDQFSSLTATTATLEPERFTNYEAGVKWNPRQHLILSSAVYRLDRTHTTAPDPADPAKTIQTGSQRTTGFEFSVSGTVRNGWEIAGGYGYQNASITSRTSAALVGARVALVPRHTLSLWNKVQCGRRVGVGVGVIEQARMFAAIDNTVTLPSFVRFDAAAYLTLSRSVRAQLNLENLFDRTYYLTSNGNNNISPGSPRAFRVALMTGF